MVRKLKLFLGYDIHSLEKEINEWLAEFPRSSRILNSQISFQMDDNTRTEGFCVAIWYEEKSQKAG